MFFNLLADEATWYPVLFDTPLNAARSVAIWLTLALVLAFIICAAVLKGDMRKKFLKISAIVAICYAAAVGITLLALTFAEDGLVTILFVPFLLVIVAVAASAVVLFFVRIKLTYAVCGSVSGAALVALFVCMCVYYASGESLGANWLESFDQVNQLGLYLSAGLLLAAVVAVAFIFDRKSKNGFDSKSISYAAICIAMSFALSYLRIVKMPQGGSITIASLVPVMLYAFMFGAKKGVLAGFILGILQAFQDPAILHPAQFILDYPAAFACIGLAGLFANFKPLKKLPQIQFALGGIIAGLARFVMHYMSGIFAFGAFAPEGQPVWLYSLIYQSGYVLPDIAIAIVVGALLLCSRSLVSIVRKVGATPKAQTEATEPAASETMEISPTTDNKD